LNQVQILIGVTKYITLIIITIEIIVLVIVELVIMKIGILIISNSENNSIVTTNVMNSSTGDNHVNF